MRTIVLAPRPFPLLVLSALTAPAFAATSNVGATVGSFAVGPTGAAAYTLPIAVPPGVNGMQPTLALAYNSQGGNGLTGMGWGLAGLSAVHRCAATIEQDGYKGGVNLDANDRLCLDGQRLVPLNGSTYWTASEYRTEIETYTRIAPFSGGYRAWTKAGQIIDYGAIDNARQQGSTGAVISWAMNQVQDRSGNYLAVSYNKNPATGEHYPQRIDYTGNASTGLAANRAVVFGYEGRSDIETAWVGGAKTQTAVRMNRVQTFVGAALVREYRLAYDVSAATGRSRLASLQECVLEGGVWVCLGANTLGWQNGQDGFTQVVESMISGWAVKFDSAKYMPMDINGDGKTDLVFGIPYGNDVVLKSLISNGTGFTQVVESIIPGWAVKFDSAKYMPMDINGDGKTDLVFGIPYGNDVVLKSLISNGTGFTQVVESIIPGWAVKFDSAKYMPMDINGDGKTDLVFGIPYGNDVVLKSLISNGTGFTQVVESIIPGWAVKFDSAKYMPMDINGDGKTDLVFGIPYGNDVVLKSLISNGTGFTQVVESIIPGWAVKFDSAKYMPMDINGDGKTDLVFGIPYGNDVVLKSLISNGTGFTQVVESIIPGWAVKFDSAKYMPMDINGDGKTDLVFGIPYGNDVVLKSLISNGTGFTQVVESIIPGWAVKFDSAQYLPMDINGDGKTDLAFGIPYVNDVVLKSMMGNGASPDLLTSATTALGAQTTITYKPLTDPSVYARENTAAYPLMDLQTPMYVVASHSASNGIGGLNTASYTYAGAKAHQTGRGFLGFRSVTATGPDGIKTISYYHQGYPYTGLPQQADIQQPSGFLLRRTVNTWTAHNLGGGRYFPYVASSTESAWELNGAALPAVTTTGSYDLLGNPTQITASASDGYTSSTANTYSNDTGTWLLGQLTQAQVTRTLPGGQSQTRTSTFGYDSAGRLLREVIEPNTVFTLTTDYGYDAHGHRNRATVSGADIATRATATDYLTSPADPYPQIRTTNALGHTEVQTLDARYGAPVSLIGPNGLTTTWAYDGFGRKVQENRADGTATTWSLAWCPSATCPSSARYLATSQSSGSAPVSVYYDILGREVRSHTLGFTGQAVYKDTQYDILGRLQYASQPYFAGGAAYWGVMSYDLLGRPVTETAPNGAVTRTSYQGLSTVVTNALNQTITRVKNSQGQLLQVTDALGSLTRYSYDPFGNLTQTVDPKSNIATLTYDLRGRKRSMTDPDMGYWEYKYNVLGELTYQMDAKGQTVTLEYDVLGRQTKRTEKEGISTWAYDTAPMGKGKLAQVTGPSGDRRTTVYDGLGRPVRTSTFIDSTTVPYDMDTGYDAYGRVGSVAYPAAGASRFTVYNTYNPQGYLSEVKNAATGQSYWKADVMDATGHLVAETFGNGLGTVRTYNPASGFLEAINTGATIQSLRYTYDSLGNLKSRADAINSVTETFAYDGLNRLTGVSGPAPKTYAYDSIGNLTGKSDIGTYTYGAKPHAVTATAGAVNATYTYDANGNMTGGNGRYLIDYTSFNLPQGIVKGDTQLNFEYGADRQRTRQTNRSTGFPSVTREITVYVNPRWDSGTHYEKTTRFLGGTIEHRHYIYAGATPVALYTTGGSVPTVRYLHKDHLGSIDTITNETGKVVERLSYDAFGKRRLTNGQDSASLLGSFTTHHGYTGHEMHDEVGLTNMNGRFYDPSLARFTQADPYIQNPTNLQDLNRYSYVNNNPLKYTDPSGYKKFWKQKWFRETVKTVAIVVAAVYTGGAAASAFLGSSAAAGLAVATGSATVMTTTAGVIAGATGGFTAGLLSSGGELKPAVRGGLGGGLTGGVGGSFGDAWSWSRVAANSVAGGVSSEINGGTFADGFKLNFITSSLTYANYSMRQAMVAQSSMNPANINGESEGFFGDGRKLAGARRELMSNGSYAACDSLMGGCQGAPIQRGDVRSSFFGFSYDAGSMPDKVNESFAGSHDWLRNLTGSYDALGNSRHFEGFALVVDTVKNYTLVLPAAPLAVSGLIMTSPAVSALPFLR